MALFMKIHTAPSILRPFLIQKSLSFSLYLGIKDALLLLSKDRYKENGLSM